MDTGHSARGHILHHIHMPAGRVFTKPRLLQVKRMLAYCTKDASTYIGDISTRPKLRNNSCVALKGTHSILRYSKLSTNGPTVPGPHDTKYHDPHRHHRVHRDSQNHPQASG